MEELPPIAQLATVQVKRTYLDHANCFKMNAVFPKDPGYLRARRHLFGKPEAASILKFFTMPAASHQRANFLELSIVIEDQIGPNAGQSRNYHRAFHYRAGACGSAKITGEPPPLQRRRFQKDGYCIRSLSGSQIPVNKPFDPGYCRGMVDLKLPLIGGSQPRTRAALCRSKKCGR